jgi:glycolate oxidase FAD binding subunit
MEAVPAWLQILKSNGVENLCSDPGALDACAIQGVRPACICTPSSEKEASAAIRCAQSQHIPVVPMGGGTQQGIGRPPRDRFLALSTRRINALIHHEPGDMVASVQAGMELEAFQKAIGARGQWLPVDGNPKSTIGGLIAANHGGPRAYGYGTLRDMVLGMTVINGDGAARKCGGKVVKNVTGYALDKLYIGSLGTLGLVSEVTFKLLPKPTARQQWTLETAGYDQAIGVVQRIDDKNLPLETLAARGQFPAANESRWTVCVSAAGTPIELARIAQEIELVSQAGPVKSTELALEWSDDEPRALRDADTKVRFWCRRATLHAVLDFFSSMSSYLEFSPSSGTVTLSATPELLAKVSKEMVALGANFQIETTRASVQIEHPFGPPRAEWALMQRIKLALDPASVLNSGRFIV